MAPSNAPPKPRRGSLEEAREFCLPLIKGNRPLCITRVNSKTLKVTFHKAATYIDVVAFINTIEQRKDFTILERGEMVQFTAPFDMEALYRLITSFKK